MLARPPAGNPQEFFHYGPLFSLATRGYDPFNKVLLFMKILIVGGGGREHALAWKFRQDDAGSEIFIAPGNAGTLEFGTNVPIGASDIPALLAWAQQNRPDLTFVGPEAPLCAGIVDAFAAQGLAIFGPNKAGAQLEGSKIFTKNILDKYNIPTAKSATFRVADEAYAYSQQQPYPQVIKADGLASGKGVTVALNPWMASRAIYDAMEKKIFGEAGAQVLIEEFLPGREASVHAVSDGSTLRVFPAAQDHKRIGDNDTGPNTGGMGAYAPAPIMTEALQKEVLETILLPVLEGLKNEGIDFRGILYAGLMISAAGPKVLEFNVRFGDPETQVILPLLETPLTEVAFAAIEGRLSSLELKIKPGAAVSIVAAAEGYPAEPRAGDEITGIAEAAATGALVFQAGTRLNAAEKIETSGGRVLAVTGYASQLAEARKNAYAGIAHIRFDGAQYRSDIAARTEA
ncbi:MAG TPA: phosphoribosylamine--glycine ligase [Candidatus Methylacidiphilales bacterium]|nr:phosphoribosylamine--glycine ligase [Candidatus Methylacidiphilales bacterium]